MKSVLTNALISGTLVAASTAVAAPADLRERVDSYLEEAYLADRPGVAVIITDNGETVYSAGRGLADMEAGTAITPRTVFRMASITKQFTAAEILKLVDEGRISLDDPVSRFFPDYPKPGADATVAQLLNHTVGIQSYTAIPGWMAGENVSRPHSTEDLIALFRDLPAPSKPGERHDYNNSGYVLLGAIIEKVTGMAWHEAIEESISRPLGLETIRYGAGETPLQGIAQDTAQDMAIGYSAVDGAVTAAIPIHMSVPHAAGALLGSVEDFARWSHALHHGRVISAQSYERMIEPTILPDGSSVPYGFGLSNSEVRGRRGIEHSGGIYGFATQGLYLPEEDLFVAVFANSDQPHTLPTEAARRIAAIAMDDPYPVFEAQEVDQARIEPLLGVYRLPDGESERHFHARDGKLFTRRSGGPDLEVFAAGENRFFYGPASLTWFRIVRDPAGEPRMEMFHDGEKKAEISLWSGPVPEPVAEAVLPRASLEALIGLYSAPMAPVLIDWGESERLTIRLGQQRAARLLPVSESEFRVEGVDARIVFHREDGKVSGLVIHQGGHEFPAPREKAPGAPAG